MEMQSPKVGKAKPGPSTVRFLDIAQIRDDVAVLNDGTIRAVLLVSSINFALKSEDEQEAIIGAYVSFLNGLEHPIQIVVQSRKLNIDKYLYALREREKAQTNQLLRAQIADYENFIKELVDLGEIMTKRFYLVVPYDPANAARKGFFARFQEVLRPGSTIRIREKVFDERREALMMRINQLVTGLNAMGLQTTLLDTQTLIELYYSIYNPQTAETQKLSDINKVQVEN